MIRLNTKFRVGRGVQNHKNNEDLLKEKMKDIIESETSNEEPKKVAQPVDVSPFKRRTDIEVFYSNSKRQKPKTWKL